jgi:hypothetical protein
MCGVDRHGLLPLAAALPILLTGCGGPPAPSAPPSPSTSVVLTVTSTAFADGGPIPPRFTCAGAGDRPPLSWSGSAGAAAYAIVVVDPDAPGGAYYHWLVVDLPAGSTSAPADIPAGARQLDNSAGRPEWTPPCPPSGIHHYRFTVYALSAPTGSRSVSAAFAAVQRTTIAQGTLTGLVTHQP